MDERPQRLVFGEVADTYDRVRPDYPDELLDDLVAAAAVPPEGWALEIGAGTGKATVPLARRGLRITCVEPDADMAGVLAARAPEVEVVVSGAEDYDPGPRRFHLVYAAQAWHWVDEERRCRLAHDLLVPGGTLALAWNRPLWEGEHTDPEVRRQVDDAYARHAPHLDAREPGFAGLTAGLVDDTVVSELDGSGLFTAVEVRSYRWWRRLETPDYLDLLRTQSNHRLLPDDVLDALLGAVEAVVDAHGGAITLDYLSKLYLARRP